MGERVTMSGKEIERLEILCQVVQGTFAQGEAEHRLGPLGTGRGHL